METYQTSSMIAGGCALFYVQCYGGSSQFTFASFWQQITTHNYHKTLPHELDGVCAWVATEARSQSGVGFFPALHPVVLTWMTAIALAVVNFVAERFSAVRGIYSSKHSRLSSSFLHLKTQTQLSAPPENRLPQPPSQHDDSDIDDEDGDELFVVRDIVFSFFLACSCCPKCTHVAVAYVFATVL
jgi:hypothetical protein